MRHSSANALRPLTEEVIVRRVESDRERVIERERDVFLLSCQIVIVKERERQKDRGRERERERKRERERDREREREREGERERERGREREREKERGREMTGKGRVVERAHGEMQQHQWKHTRQRRAEGKK